MRTVEARTLSTAGEDAVTAVAGAVVVVGVYTDGWAHINLGGLESFFTPWHAILYGGSAVLVGWMAALVLLRRRRTGRWLVPAGYGWGWVGAALFALGGAGDMVWHLVFGIEVGIEALVSPTHLLLLTGGVLMLTSPVRAALAHGWSPPRRWPAVLAVAGAVALAGFFLSYLSVFTDPAARQALVVIPHGAPGHEAAELLPVAGLGAYLVSTVLMVAPVLFLRRRQLLPPGAITVVVAAVALPPAVLTELEFWAPALSAITAAALLDLAVAQRRYLSDISLASSLPVAVWGGQLLGLALTGTLGWSPELWAGVVILSALTAAGLAWTMPTATQGRAGLETPGSTASPAVPGSGAATPGPRSRRSEPAGLVRGSATARPEPPE